MGGSAPVRIGVDAGALAFPASGVRRLPTNFARAGVALPLAIGSRDAR